MKFRVILYFLLIFLTAQTAFSKELTFSVISDAKIEADKTDNKMTPSIKKLLVAKNDINKSDSAFVLFLGDNIKKPDKYNLVMFSKITDMVSKPVYVTIGNQDTLKTKNLTKKEYYRLLNKFSHNKVSNVPCAKNIDDFLFIFADGTSEAIPSKRGYFKEKELIRLDKILSKNKNKSVIIAQHFPLKDLGENSLQTTYKSEEYFEILKKHKNVKAIISGHVNKDFEITDENGIKHIGVPSLYEQGEYKVIKIRTTANGLNFETKVISVE